jgi:hypothetical protein
VRLYRAERQGEQSGGVAVRDTVARSPQRARRRGNKEPVHQGVFQTPCLGVEKHAKVPVLCFRVLVASDWRMTGSVWDVDKLRVAADAAGIAL